MSLGGSGLAEEAYAVLVETIRRRLKNKILEAIDRDVDAAVEEAVERLGVAVKLFEDPYLGRGMIEVVLRGKETRE